MLERERRTDPTTPWRLRFSTSRIWRERDERREGEEKTGVWWSGISQGLATDVELGQIAPPALSSMQGRERRCVAGWRE
jgi:hypothetical protein